jgi:hypothetical protein
MEKKQSDEETNRRGVDIAFNRVWASDLAHKSITVTGPPH